ncbi:carboxypeptidase regulatory-like domain-containing protein [Novisyntrophococcus fermenticellae]|uniref:carboxypeptidase regulatory-like domain-containing protein n=1 Tax=Novisyntrophococcus fermenticellae TaxID=2068655 RepID=UPI001E50E8D3|nr:carboxypeptidase regulatory-like domain-containing protein [Novisyntrophococcus fermenticellae]
MLPPLTRDEADYENNYDDGVKTWDNLAGNNASTAISVESGQTKIVFPGGGHANAYETMAPQFKNGCVEMDITSAKEAPRIGILLRATDMTHRVYLGTGDTADTWFAEYWNGSGNTWSDMHAGNKFAANTAMHLKAEIVDNTASLWVNGTLVVRQTMSGMPSGAGYVGLNSRQSHTVYVDNVKVTSYDLPAGNLQNIAGNVVNTDGTVIENALVELLNNSGDVLKKTTTDALGNYKFKNIEIGEYQVRITSGEFVKEIPVTVVTGDDYVVVDKAVIGQAVKTELQDLISYAESQKQEPQYQYVVPAVKTLFEQRLTEAIAVNDKEHASQTEVDEAYKALLHMVHMLSYIGNSESLKVLAECVEGMQLEGVYTEETVKSVREALDAAKGVLANENALQDEIDAAKDALQNAIDALEKIPVDKSRLEKLVKEAGEYEAKSDQYTPVTAESFKAALEGARAVLADKEAIQEKVDSAYGTLQNAIFALREIPDKSKLEGLIKKVEKLDLNEYTAQTVSPLRAALAIAKETVEDPNATKADVDAAEKRLQESIDGLKKTKAQTDNENDKTDGSSKPDGSNTSGGGSKPITNKQVKTGDTTNIAVWAVLMVLALGCGCITFILVRKRRLRK